MTEEQKITPGAGVRAEQPIAGSSLKAVADKKSIEAMTREELVEACRLQEESINYLSRRLSAVQAQLGKQQSVELTYGRRKVQLPGQEKPEERMDITGVSVKAYGFHGLQAANESIASLVAAEVALYELGFLQDCQEIPALPGKIKEAMEKATRNMVQEDE